jgi:hypothetical protein
MRARATGASREAQRELLLRFEVRAFLTPSSACDPWLPLALGITSAFLQFVFALPACKFPQLSVPTARFYFPYPVSPLLALLESCGKRFD